MSSDINLVFFTSTAGHYSFKDVYRTTILHYKKLFGDDFKGFKKVFAHVKVRPKEEALLPEMIDFLYEQDIQPIVTIGDWERGMSHQHEYLKDLRKVFSDPEVIDSEFLFWVEDDSPLKLKLTADKSSYFVMMAMDIMKRNPAILNLRFLREGLESKNKLSDLLSVSNVFDFQPNISRSRDLYVATTIIFNHWDTFKNMQCEAAFRLAMDTLSAHPYRYLTFNPDWVTSYHIGAPDYEDYLKLPDFQFNK